MQKDKIKISGHIGSWYIIDEKYFQGKKVYLLEHETYGDDAASLIVDEDLNIILDNVWNGFSDLDGLY
jgi:hypothetical protein